MSYLIYFSSSAERVHLDCMGWVQKDANRKCFQAVGEFESDPSCSNLRERVVAADWEGEEEEGAEDGGSLEPPS